MEIRRSWFLVSSAVITTAVCDFPLIYVLFLLDVFMSFYVIMLGFSHSFSFFGALVEDTDTGYGIGSGVGTGLYRRACEGGKRIELEELVKSQDWEMGFMLGIMFY